MRKKLKVCHVSSMHQWNDDRIFERACFGLQKEGYNVKLIATHESGKAFLDSGVEVIPIKERKGLRRRIFSSFEATKKARKTEADIIHFHDPDLLPFMWVLSWFRKGVIFDIHENYQARIHALSLPSLIIKLLSASWRFFEKTCIRSFSGFVVTTETMGELYRSTRKQWCVVSNMPFLERLKEQNRSSTEKRPGVNLYVSGSHSKQRNCMQAVEALPLVVKEFPEIKLVFAGRYVPYGFDEQLRKKAEELNVSDHLELEGMLPWLENFNRTASMHVGFVFYEDNPNNRVTIPNRLFEYMISGLAVIGESFTEVKRVIDEADCGFCCNSSDPADIARAVTDLLRSDKDLEEFGENGRKAVEEKFNFESELERMIEYYHRVCT
jgi:glycosyltransferase involved in cell wall biosynthesis